MQNRNDKGKCNGKMNLSGTMNLIQKCKEGKIMRLKSKCMGKKTAKKKKKGQKVNARKMLPKKKRKRKQWKLRVKRGKKKRRNNQGKRVNGRA